MCELIAGLPVSSSIRRQVSRFGIVTGVKPISAARPRTWPDRHAPLVDSFGRSPLPPSVFVAANLSDDACSRITHAPWRRARRS
jgi:hypothetical protein